MISDAWIVWIITQEVPVMFLLTGTEYFPILISNETLCIYINIPLINHQLTNLSTLTGKNPCSGLVILM
jgi:hypothetical protein